MFNNHKVDDLISSVAMLKVELSQLRNAIQEAKNLEELKSRVLALSLEVAFTPRSVRY